MDTKTAPKTSSTPRSISSWVARVNAGLKLRAGAEREIAAALAEHKNKVGTKRWLEDCEKEWGWSRSTAYRHLDPAQMDKARAHTCEQRAKAPEELADAFRWVDGAARPNVGTPVLAPEDILTAAEASRATTLTQTADKDIKEPIDPQIAAAREVRRRAAEHLIRLGHTAAVEEEGVRL